MEQQTTNFQPESEYQPIPEASTSQPILSQSPTTSVIPPTAVKTKKSLFFPILLIVIVLLVGGGYFSLTVLKNETRNKSYKTVDNMSDSQTKTTPQNSATSINKSYINEDVGFSFEYPATVNFADNFMIDAPDPRIVVIIKDLNNYEDDTNGYTRENAIIDQKGLEQSKLMVTTGWPVNGSERLVSLSEKINGREFMTLSAYEVCDVNFHRDLIFYHNNKQIIITYTGDKNMIEEASAYSTQDVQNCGEKIIWNFDNNGMEKLFQSLLNGTGPTNIQKWYDKFDVIVSSLKF